MCPRIQSAGRPFPRRRHRAAHGGCRRSRLRIRAPGRGGGSRRTLGPARRRRWWQRFPLSPIWRVRRGPVPEKGRIRQRRHRSGRSLRPRRNARSGHPDRPPTVDRSARCRSRSTRPAGSRRRPARCPRRARSRPGRAIRPGRGRTPPPPRWLGKPPTPDNRGNRPWHRCRKRPAKTGRSAPAGARRFRRTGPADRCRIPVALPGTP